MVVRPSFSQLFISKDFYDSCKNEATLREIVSDKRILIKLSISLSMLINRSLFQFRQLYKPSLQTALASKVCVAKAFIATSSEQKSFLSLEATHALGFSKPSCQGQGCLDVNL